MRARRRLIHVSLGDGSSFSTHFHQIQYFLRFYHRPLWHALDVYAFSGIFSDIELFFLISEQIADYFVVDLNVGRSHHESSILIFAPLNESEDIFDGSRNDAPIFVGHAVLEPFHRVGLSCSCLSVGEYGRVVAFESWADWQSCSIFVHLFLRGFVVVDVVEGVLMSIEISMVVDVRF